VFCIFLVALFISQCCIAIPMHEVEGQREFFLMKLEQQVHPLFAIVLPLLLEIFPAIMKATFYFYLTVSTHAFSWLLPDGEFNWLHSSDNFLLILGNVIY
jgi:hypothetical protein